MFAVELLVVLVALAIGARLGGIFLGIAGGMGLAILAIFCGLAPSSPPMDVMLIITSVIVAAAALQVAGGMDFLVGVAERILRANPKYITFLAPMVCYLFTIMAGTGNIAFALCRLSLKFQEKQVCVLKGRCLSPSWQVSRQLQQAQFLQRWLR